MIDWDDIEVCFICEKNHECTQGGELAELDNEWVCNRCQSDAESNKEEIIKRVNQHDKLVQMDKDLVRALEFNLSNPAIHHKTREEFKVLINKAKELLND